VSLSHSTCCRPASATTLQNLPVCSDCQYVSSPGRIGCVDGHGLTGTNSSGGSVPVPLVLPQVKALERLLVRQVPGPATL
jgi:hypothetical protein